MEEADRFRFICATLADKGETVLFRTYKPPSDCRSMSEIGNKIKHDKVTIKEACRATSAAPTWLPDIWIQKLRFWDGGLLNNNPIDQVWDARYDLDIGRTEAAASGIKPDISCVVSIGTSYTKKPEGNSFYHFIDTMKTVAGLATNTEAKHWDFESNNFRRNRRLPKDKQTKYFRFDAVTPEKIYLDDYRQMEQLETWTDDYLNQPEVASAIDKCATLLARP